MIAKLMIVCGGLAAAACASSQAGQGADTPGPWTAEIAPVGTAGHGGRASATPMNGATHVTVFLTGGSAGGVHPWHVHEGVCESNGPVVGAASMYPALTPDASGNATAEAHINFPLDPTGSYYVNIHQSASQLDSIVGCGELSRGEGS